VSANGGDFEYIDSSENFLFKSVYDIDTDIVTIHIADTFSYI